VKSQHIMTELPGPKARALIERDARVMPPVHMRDYAFVMDHGLGTEVWDVDGNRFLDFAAGIAVCSTGHCHPEVVAAIKNAADRFLHISPDYWHEQHVALAETMARVAPVDDPVTFCCNSGTESVEAALKLARYVTGRPRFIGFLGGFHGRSMGSLAFTSSKYTQQTGYFPTMAGVTHVPFPNPYRPLFAGVPPAALPAQPAAVGGRGHPRRAHPGRGRLPRRARRIPEGAARALRRARHAAHLRRSAERHRTHGPDVRV
jgi:4-aminobutyrate aminotransferase